MNFRKLLFLPLLFLMVFTSCQNEENEIITAPLDEIIEGDSNAASLMSRTASNDGSIDNILDYANCLEVLLPVTITANGVTITIESVTDFDALEALLDAFTNDADEVVFTFPITVILNDYTQIVINNQDELNAQIANCNGENEDDDDIECIDFQYPIVFSIYNTDFQVTDTVTIENDEALYLFLDTLNGPVLASLNFPVTLVLANGETIEVNNNQELEIAISEAEDDCDEDDDYDYNDDDVYTEDQVYLYLLECYWPFNTSLYDNVVGEYFDFQENNEVLIYNSVTNQISETGTWFLSTVNDEIVVSLSFNLNTMISLDWTVLTGNEVYFQFANSDDTLTIEQDCNITNNSPFECFQSFNAVLEVCDELNDGIEVFNLNLAFDNCITPNYIVTYHVAQADADGDFNAIAYPETYTNYTNPETIYVRVEVANNPDLYEVFTIDLVLTDCTSTCTELDVDGYLQTCIWNVVNYNGSNDLIYFDLDFNSDGSFTITGNGSTTVANWSTSQTNDDVWVEFSNVNVANIQAITGNWLVVECEPDRLQMDLNGTIMVMEQDCN